jgi:anti-anti-sigma factor
MTIESVSVGKAVVVKVAGRIDAQTTGEFEAACKRLIQEGATHVVVDFTELQYISSAGLSSILRFAKELEGKGGLVVISGLKGLVKQVFELTNLIGVFRVFETAEAACRSI